MIKKKTLKKLVKPAIDKLECWCSMWCIDYTCDVTTCPVQWAIKYLKEE